MMYFCRIEHDAEDTVYGEGLNAKDAFQDANSKACFDVGPNCIINFWKAEKANIGIRFNAEIFERNFK